MIFRNLIFEAEIVEKRLRAGMVSHHERQASKRCSEQQHRWPAYNVNVAPLQALTERLFQHTRLISTFMVYHFRDGTAEQAQVHAWEANTRWPSRASVVYS